MVWNTETKKHVTTCKQQVKYNHPCITYTFTSFYYMLYYVFKTPFLFCYSLTFNYLHFIYITIPHDNRLTQVVMRHTFKVTIKVVSHKAWEEIYYTETLNIIQVPLGELWCALTQIELLNYSSCDTRCLGYRPKM